MTTVADIVSRAHSKIGIKAADESLTAYQMQTGVEALGMMLSGWRLHGVDALHSPLTADNPFPMQSEFEEGAVYNLAARLSSDYQVPAMFDTDGYFRAIQASYMKTNTATLPSAILRTPSQQWPVR